MKNDAQDSDYIRELILVPFTEIRHLGQGLGLKRNQASRARIRVEERNPDGMNDFGAC